MEIFDVVECRLNTHAEEVIKEAAVLEYIFTNVLWLHMDLNGLRDGERVDGGSHTGREHR